VVKIVPIAIHGLEVLLSEGSQGKVAARGAAWRRFGANQKVAITFEAGENGVDCALGDDQLVDGFQSGHYLIAVAFLVSKNAKDAVFEKSFSELCDP
jgi:hypothetical protein